MDTIIIVLLIITYFFKTGSMQPHKESTWTSSITVKSKARIGEVIFSIPDSEGDGQLQIDMQLCNASKYCEMVHQNHSEISVKSCLSSHYTDVVHICSNNNGTCHGTLIVTVIPFWHRRISPMNIIILLSNTSKEEDVIGITKRSSSGEYSGFKPGCSIFSTNTDRLFWISSGNNHVMTYATRITYGLLYKLKTTCPTRRDLKRIAGISYDNIYIRVRFKVRHISHAEIEVMPLMSDLQKLTANLEKILRNASNRSTDTLVIHASTRSRTRKVIFQERSKRACRVLRSMVRRKRANEMNQGRGGGGGGGGGEGGTTFKSTSRSTIRTTPFTSSTTTQKTNITAQPIKNTTNTTSSPSLKTTSTTPPQTTNTTPLTTLNTTSMAKVTTIRTKASTTGSTRPLITTFTSSASSTTSSTTLTTLSITPITYETSIPFVTLKTTPSTKLTATLNPTPNISEAPSTTLTTQPSTKQTTTMNLKLTTNEASSTTLTAKPITKQTTTINLKLTTNEASSTTLTTTPLTKQTTTMNLKLTTNEAPSTTPSTKQSAIINPTPTTSEAPSTTLTTTLSTKQTSTMNSTQTTSVAPLTTLTTTPPTTWTTTTSILSTKLATTASISWTATLSTPSTESITSSTRLTTTTSTTWKTSSNTSTAQSKIASTTVLPAIDTMNMTMNATISAPKAEQVSSKDFFGEPLNVALICTVAFLMAVGSTVGIIGCVYSMIAGGTKRKRSTSILDECTSSSSDTFSHNSSSCGDLLSSDAMFSTTASKWPLTPVETV